VIVNLQGGIGNQCFQWAFGRSVSLARKEELFFDISHCRSEDQYSYSLDAFDIDVPTKSRENREERGEPVFRYDPTVGMDPPGLYWNGYWQTEKYFNIPVIRKELKFKIQPRPIALELAEEIRKQTSCFIHVRGGDYLREPHKSFHGNMTMGYYNMGIDYIKEFFSDTKFFVFSDNPDWCRRNFPSNFTLVEGTNKFEDMQLMSYCDNAIICNSSFSWWGAWFNDEKQGRIVIAPQSWFQDKNMCQSDIVPDRWVRL
jgi:hypothetical protein